MLQLLRLAGKAANPNTDHYRTAFVGAVCVRLDGVLVSSRNGSTSSNSEKIPSAHAEARIVNRSGYGAIIYVARVRRDGSLAMAKPCSRCEASMRSMRVKKVYYTINETEYGVICL